MPTTKQQATTDEQARQGRGRAARGKFRHVLGVGSAAPDPGFAALMEEWNREDAADPERGRAEPWSELKAALEAERTGQRSLFGE